MRSMASCRLVTNNPLCRKIFTGLCPVLFVEAQTCLEMLIRVRDMVYGGYRLYTHPLSGSVKPNETPYKSLLLSRVPDTVPDGAEVMMIADAVATAEKLKKPERILTEKTLQDFQLIDYTLIASAMDYDAAEGLSRLRDNKSFTKEVETV